MKFGPIHGVLSTSTSRNSPFSVVPSRSSVHRTGFQSRDDLVVSAQGALHSGCCRLHRLCHPSSSHRFDACRDHSPADTLDDGAHTPRSASRPEVHHAAPIVTQAANQILDRADISDAPRDVVRGAERQNGERNRAPCHGRGRRLLPCHRHRPRRPGPRVGR